MMSTITEAYINAILADATYALTSSNINGITGGRLEDILKERMTPELAKYIGENFTVVTNIDTDDVAESGFDATVWVGKTEEVGIGKTYVSMRGSEGFLDFIDDVYFARAA
jgi:hypothetical protein